MISVDSTGHYKYVFMFGGGNIEMWKIVDVQAK